MKGQVKARFKSWGGFSLLARAVNYGVLKIILELWQTCLLPFGTVCLYPAYYDSQ